MKHLLLILPLLLADSAYAQALRDFCGDRPGLGTPACTVDRGHLQLEVGLADWTRDRQPESQEDTILAGDILVRYGLTGSLEARIGWVADGHVSQRSRITGSTSRSDRVGDVMLGLRQNLRNPDGSGLSLALSPYATLPVGRRPVGEGDWGAGLVASASYEVSDSLQLEFTPEVNAAINESGHGRHFAFGGTAGMTDKLSDALSATLEYQALRDRDPGGHETRELAGLSLAWQPGPRSQIDLGSNFGLDHAAPDVELYVGISRKF